MPDLTDEVEDTVPETALPAKLPAHELLQNFLKEQNITLGFSVLKVRQIDDGALIIDQPTILATYGKPSTG